jgi:hypothetical protein
MFKAQQFAARLAERKDRWSLLTDFVAEWHTPLQEGGGCSPKELDAAERRLGLTLPLALREWYQLAGKREDVTATCNFLASPEELEIMEENGLLVFYCENQQVVEWGVQEADLALADPPVWLDNSGLHSTRQEPVRENDTLSEFALQMVVLETMFEQKAFQASGKVAPQMLKRVDQNFLHLGFPDWHWPDYPTRFYGGDDVLLQAFGEEDVSLQVTARSLAAFEKAKAALEITWEHFLFSR